MKVFLNIVLLFGCLTLCISYTPQKTNLEDSSIELYSKGNTYYKSYQHKKAYDYYYKSYTLAKQNNKKLLEVKSLYKLALIDYYHSNYIIAEKTCTNIFALTQKTKNNKLLTVRSNSLNLMGLIALEKDDYKTALEYFKKYRKNNINTKDSLISFLRYSNNMGLVFQKEKNYPKAYNYYKRITDLKDLKIKKPAKYARALDNKAWCLFQENKLKLSKPLLDTAFSIRKRINDKPGLIMSYKHLSRYFLRENSINKAVNHAKEALKYCEETHNSKSKLEVLYLLSEIDPKKSHVYFKEYHQLKEDLIKKEREFKDQTARIRYGTKEKEEQIKIKDAKLSTKNKIITGAILASLVLALITIKIFRQKKRITQQKEAIQSLQREVHHTAKNNLYKAIVYTRQAANNPNSEAFLELENRIKSMLNLHQILYSTGKTPGDALQEYIQTICDELHKSYTDNKKEITYQVQVKGKIPYKEVKLIGIIINELVTNIYKYAFVNKEQGSYIVQIRRDYKDISISVRDTGVGFPKDFDVNNVDSYGLQMIDGLTVKQLNGEFEIRKTKKENEVFIKFKIQKK